MDEFIQKLRSYPEFKHVQAKLQAQKPTIPAYDYYSDNTEEWKALSNQRKGYDLALSILGESIT